MTLKQEASRQHYSVYSESWKKDKELINCVAASNVHVNIFESDY